MRGTESRKNLKFSRDQLTEFVAGVSSEVTEIIIMLSSTGDKALIIRPFCDEALVVHSGQSVAFGEVIEGSIPERHSISIRNTKL